MTDIPSEHKLLDGQAGHENEILGGSFAEHFPAQVTVSYISEGFDAGIGRKSNGLIGSVSIFMPLCGLHGKREERIFF